MAEPRFIIAHSLDLKDENWLLFRMSDAIGTASSWSALNEMRKRLEAENPGSGQ